MVNVNRPDYVLGHSDYELGRLGRQAMLLDATTREYLATAGLEPGMRVLDVGSGPGDVAFLASELTMPGGEVGWNGPGGRRGERGIGDRGGAGAIRNRSLPAG